MFNHLDLFAGIGGFSLGLERTGGFKTIAFCEIEPYPQKVLKKHWPEVPIANDVTKLTYQDGVLYDDGKAIFRGTIHSFSGGFPCQDISTAGRQAGIGEGTRSGLWSECARLLGEIRPRFALFENVTNLLNGERGDWFKRVLWEISKIGYDAEWHCIPASELGAHHHRDRVWIIAYPAELLCDGGDNNPREFLESESIPKPGNGSGEDDVADTDSTQCERSSRSLGILAEYADISGPGRWQAEPDVGGRLDGFSAWLDGVDIEEPHKLLLANGEKEARARKELYALWLSDAAEALWGQVRGLQCVSAEAVLFAYLRQFKKRGADQAWLQLACQETPETELRGVWTRYIASRTPHRSKHQEQQTGEHPDPLQALSQLLAHASEKAWTQYCRENAVPVGWEEGISRVADLIPDRAHRLKGLGNAVVPQIPEIIGRAILECST